MLLILTWSAVRQSLVYFLMQVTNSDHVLGKRTLKSFIKTNIFFYIFSRSTHLQTWSTSSLAAGKTYRGSSSKGSASLMQELRVSVLQSNLPPPWLLTRPGKENCISPHFKSPFMDPVFAIPQLKSLSLCLCSRLISCNIISNKNRDMLSPVHLIERTCFY